MPDTPLILSLFDRSGVMVAPWRARDFRTLTVDLHPATHDGPSLQADLDDPAVWAGLRALQPAAIFAFPPCTDLAASGARWWAAKDARDPDTLPRAIRRAVRVEEMGNALGVPFMIENPIGRLATKWRPSDWKFDPCDFAGFAEDPAEEAFTKRTCIWTGDTAATRVPRPNFPGARLEPVLGSKMHRIPPCPERNYLRSLTPTGFARAMFATLSPKVQP